MIQRIQTAFLLIATMFIGFLLFFPIAEIISPEHAEVYKLGFRGLQSETNSIPLGLSVLPLSLLIAICLIISFFTIFLYKKRMVQVRLSIFNIIIHLGLQGLAFYYVKAAQSFISGEVSYTLFFVFPVVSAILIFLALRAISRDEALVRSLDRLR
jgi:hypothetical protein